MTERRCSVEDCTDPYLAKGLCHLHYYRLKNGVPLDQARRVVDGSQGCSIDGCPGEHLAKGYCESHYRRWKRTGDPLPKPRVRTYRGLCAADGCDEERRKTIYCAFHYQRVRKGVPLDQPLRGGEHVKYAAVHLRVQAAKGKASEHRCVDCGAQAQEWSYNNSGIKEQQDATGRYSTDLDQYDPRCKPCHRRFDAAHQSAQTV